MFKPFSAISRRVELSQVEIAGAKCLALRIAYTGELGWELYIPNADTQKVYKELREQGRDLDLGHFGTMTLNTMRLEKGFKMWGPEMNLDVTAAEAGLDSFIRFKKKVSANTFSQIRPSSHLKVLKPSRLISSGRRP